MTLSAFALLGNSFAISAEIPSEMMMSQPFIEKLEGLDGMVNRALETFNVPGVAVGIIMDGKVVFTKGYGFRDRTNSLPVTENTLFAIGSCTKAFTTHVLGQLADEGTISWDDPVIKYLPEFRLKDEYAAYHMTIRDLATHQSGLPRHDLLWYNSNLSRHDLLHRLQYLDSSSDLRGKFQYNNLMYVVAGLVIEKVTGLSWEEAVRARVLLPLGMNRSNFSVLDSQKEEDFSLPYREKNDSVEVIPFNNIQIAGPAGSINSSAVEMVKWINLQLSDGTFEGHRFLKKETLQAMHVPQVGLRMIVEEFSNLFGYGLGWFTGIHKGHYYVVHGGGIDGFISSVGFLPKEKIGVVVLTNSDSSMMFAESLSEAILDRTLGLTSDDWMVEVKEKDEKIKKSLACSSQESLEQLNKDSSIAVETARPIADYIGEFEHPGYGTITLRTEGEHLLLSYHTLSVPLSHQCYDHFTGKWETFSGIIFNCSFVRDHFGDISELHMPMEPAVEKIAFKRKAGNELLAIDYLKEFEGIFEGDLFSINIILKGNQLMAVIPGAPDEYALIPEKSSQFSLKGMQGATLHFTWADEKIEVRLQTPNGAFKFKAK